MQLIPPRDGLYQSQPENAHPHQRPCCGEIPSNVKSSEGPFVVSATQYCPTLLEPHRPQSGRLLCPWDFPSKNTGGGCYFHLQGTIPTQGSNPLAGGFSTTEPPGKSMTTAKSQH